MNQKTVIARMQTFAPSLLIYQWYWECCDSICHLKRANLYTMYVVTRRECWSKIQNKEQQVFSF